MRQAGPIRSLRKGTHDDAATLIQSRIRLAGVRAASYSRDAMQLTSARAGTLAWFGVAATLNLFGFASFTGKERVVGYVVAVIAAVVVVVVVAEVEDQILPIAIPPRFCP